MEKEELKPILEKNEQNGKQKANIDEININKNYIKDLYFEEKENDSLIISTSKDYNYFCEIKFTELKKKYKILSSIKNKEKFIKLLKQLLERNKIYISFYIPEILTQISLVLTSLFGEEEIITFELKYKDFDKEIQKVLIKKLIKMNKKKKQILNKSIK